MDFIKKNIKNTDIEDANGTADVSAGTKIQINKINSVLHDDLLHEVFINTIIDSYYYFYENITERTGGIERISIKPSEMFCTYLNDLENIKRKFRKTLHKIYMQKIKQERNDIENLKSIHKLYIYIENIIQEVLNDVLTYKNNIYQNMFLKSRMFIIGIK